MRLPTGLRPVMCVIAGGVLLLGCATPVTAPPDDATKHPVTVDDVLHIAMVGDARFSPDGRWLAYNVVPPYDELSDYSYWLYAARLSGHQLWIKDLAGDRAPRLQPGLDASATNYLVAISPDSRRVVVLEHKMGRLRLAACRIGHDDCVWFEDPPDIRDGYFTGFWWNERLAWTSPTTFVMPTRDADLPGSEQHSRGVTGAYLWREWNAAWRGREPTASEVVSTGRDRSEDWASGRLMEFDLGSGEARVVQEGRHAGVRASPDHRVLVAARVGERQRPPTDAPLVRTETHPFFDRRYAPRVIDRETGATRDVAKPFNVDPASFTWSADGRRFAAFGWERDETARDGRFYMIDAESLEARRGAPDRFDVARTDGRTDSNRGPAQAALLDAGLAVYARPDEADRFDWFLFDADGGVRNLSEGVAGVTSNLLHADARSVTVQAADGPYRLDVDGTRTRLTPERDGVFRSVLYQGGFDHGWSNEYSFNTPHTRPSFREDAAFVRDSDGGGDDEVAFVAFETTDGQAGGLRIEAPGAKVLAASRAADAAVATVKDGVATRLLLVRAGRAPVELTRINDHLNAIADPQTRDVSYTLNDPDGVDAPRETGGCLLLPPDYQDGRRYPLIIEVYPIGVERSCRTLRDLPMPGMTSADLWPARGFAYFRPAVPLDFARTPEGPIAGMDEIADQAVDALVAQGYADPERVVLYGMSQGGVSSLYVATQSDRFAAVISVNGWADLFSHSFGARGLRRYFHLDQNGGDNRWRYECMEEGAEHLCPFGFGVTALDDPELYARNSPVALAQGVTAPVLLVHSDLDYFDMAQYDEMFGALYRAGKEARYVRYWGEGHGPSSPANIRDMWERFDAFLAETGVAPVAAP